ncbi:MAG: permease [Telluria sp.]
MQRALSLEDTPALAVPLRFMLTAPWFACAAGLLLAWSGPDALASRWTPAALALTHLMTLGFLAMTMAGAMLQMLPVVAGLAVPAVRPVARLCWLGLASGTALLALAFVSGRPLLFIMAAPVLALALLCFAVAVARALARRTAAGALAMTIGMRIAVASLGIVAVLGVLLAASFAGVYQLPVLQVTSLHAAWGLVGWVALLVIAVSFQVIPMFQSTPAYPRALTLALPPSVAVLLAAWSIGSWSQARWAAWPAALIALLLAAFAGFTLYRLALRKRAPDVTSFYWLLSLASLLGCVLLHFLLDADNPRRPVLLGILFIGGFAASAVNGMLYKIVPFLLWYHLGIAGIPRGAVPGVSAWITGRASKAQCCAYAAAMAMLAGSVCAPELVRPGALLFAAATAWLGALLLAAARRYRQALAASATVSA